MCNDGDDVIGMLLHTVSHHSFHVHVSVVLHAFLSSSLVSLFFLPYNFEISLLDKYTPSGVFQSLLSTPLLTIFFQWINNPLLPLLFNPTSCSSFLLPYVTLFPNLIFFLLLLVPPLSPFSSPHHQQQLVPISQQGRQTGTVDQPASSSSSSPPPPPPVAAAGTAQAAVHINEIHRLLVTATQPC